MNKKVNWYRNVLRYCNEADNGLSIEAALRMVTAAGEQDPKDREVPSVLLVDALAEAEDAPNPSWALETLDTSLLWAAWEKCDDEPVFRWFDMLTDRALVKPGKAMMMENILSTVSSSELFERFLPAFAARLETAGVMSPGEPMFWAACSPGVLSRDQKISVLSGGQSPDRYPDRVVRFRRNGFESRVVSMLADLAPFTESEMTRLCGSGVPYVGAVTLKYHVPLGLMERRFARFLKCQEAVVLSAPSLSPLRDIWDTLLEWFEDTGLVVASGPHVLETWGSDLVWDRTRIEVLDETWGQDSAVGWGQVLTDGWRPVPEVVDEVTGLFTRLVTRNLKFEKSGPLESVGDPQVPASQRTADIVQSVLAAQVMDPVAKVLKDSSRLDQFSLTLLVDRWKDSGAMGDPVVWVSGLRAGLAVSRLPGVVFEWLESRHPRLLENPQRLLGCVSAQPDLPLSDVVSMVHTS